MSDTINKCPCGKYILISDRDICPECKNSPAMTANPMREAFVVWATKNGVSLIKWGDECGAIAGKYVNPETRATLKGWNNACQAMGEALVREMAAIKDVQPLPGGRTHNAAVDGCIEITKKHMGGE